MKLLLIQAFNTAILLFILIRQLKEPLRSFVATRHSTIRDELAQVSEQLAGSKIRFEEFSAKLRAIDAEVASLRAQAKQDAQNMKTRTLADAQRLASSIVADSKVSAQGLYAELRSQLRTELAEKVVDRAEALLRDRLTGDDRVRIRREFSKQVERIQ
jgi:F-type H+-transporting ATPase subunit b